MSYQAIWFKNAAEQLQITDFSLSFSILQTIVCDRLPLLVQEMKRKHVDLDDPSSWWEALFINQVVVIENAQGKQLRVAVYLSDRWKLVQTTLKIIESPKFQSVRVDLGIDRHWIIYVDRTPLSTADWCNLLYANIDIEPTASGCAVIEV